MGFLYKKFNFNFNYEKIYVFRLIFIVIDICIVFNVTFKDD